MKQFVYRNPFTGFSVGELEEAYSYFTRSKDCDSRYLVTEAFDDLVSIDLSDLL